MSYIQWTCLTDLHEGRPEVRIYHDGAQAWYLKCRCYGRETYTDPWCDFGRWHNYPLRYLCNIPTPTKTTHTTLRDTTGRIVRPSFFNYCTKTIVLRDRSTHVSLKGRNHIKTSIPIRIVKVGCHFLKKTNENSTFVSNPGRQAVH